MNWRALSSLAAWLYDATLDGHVHLLLGGDTELLLASGVDGGKEGCLLRIRRRLSRDLVHLRLLVDLLIFEDSSSSNSGVDGYHSRAPYVIMAHVVARWCGMAGG
jgi:hypothetical protein